jgi:hypothetical protein
MRDGRQISGESLAIQPAGVTLKATGKPDVFARRDELSAVFFRATLPAVSPPGSGVRIISANGDTLDAPQAELTESGVVLDLDPGTDPVHLPRDRLAGVVWAVRAPAAKAGTTAPSHRIELRTGERLNGHVVSLDGEFLTLKGNGEPQRLDRREVQVIWFGPRAIRLAQDQISDAPASGERPVFRRGRHALGGPLRLGRRVYQNGIGLRGPVSLDIPVPPQARWFLADVGADADAARFARVVCEVLVDGQSRSRYEGLAPMAAARTVAVRVDGAERVTLRVTPTDDDPTGCLGDFADAMFIE